MNITCHCSSCGAAYQVREEYAGRRIKCPKCSAPVMVPAATDAPAPPSKPLAEAAAAPAVSERPKGPPPPKRLEKTPPSAAVADAEPLATEVPGGIAIPGLDTAAPRHSRGTSHPKKKKAKGNGLALGIGLGVGALLLAIGITAAVLMSSRSAANSAGADGSKEGAGKKSATVAANAPELLLEWPEADRAQARVFIDGDEMTLPRSGPVKFPLRIRNEPYRFRLERPGFKSIEFNRPAVEEHMPYTVDWVALPPGLDGWNQDFEKAKQSKKRILVFFDASWSPPCQQLTRDVFSKKEFSDRVAADFELVHIDVPHTADTTGKIEDVARNKKLAEQFGVKDFPTILVTNKEGLPVGIEQKPIQGMKPFMDLLDRWKQVDTDMQRLTSEIGSAAEGPAKHTAITKLLDLLHEEDLDRFYETQTKQWLAALPEAQRARALPCSKTEYNTWTSRLGQANTPPEATKVVDEFDQWKKNRAFRDPNIGADLHLKAAIVLARIGQFPRALEKCKEGLACKPTNEQLEMILEGVRDRLEGGDVDGTWVAGTGTGFCIAEGGWVLTNHHVISKAKRVKVCIAGRNEPVPAKIIASDAKNDIALLKVELPAGVKLPPVPLVPDIKAGERVCCLGYPDKGRRQSLFRTTVTVTAGIVSNAPSADDLEGDIETDCRVNPGNSGGPLCNSRGVIVGMVKAKTLSDRTRDSFGIVIPIAKLREFFKKHPPGAPLPKLDAVPKESMEWAQVRERMEPSVVRILNYQEMSQQGPDPGPEGGE